MFAVIPTDRCQRKLDQYHLAARVAHITADLGNAREPMVLRRYFRSVPPHWIHRTGRLRLIGSLRTVKGGKSVLCLLDVMEDTSASFRELCRNPRSFAIPAPDDADLEAALLDGEDAGVIELEPLPRELWDWLERPGWGPDVSGTEIVVYESGTWLQRFRHKEIQRYWQDYYDLLLDVVNDDARLQSSRVPPAEVALGEDVALLFRRFRPDTEAERDVVFLIAPLPPGRSGEAQDDAAAGAADVLALRHDAGFEEIARHAERAYPDYLLGHREAWIAIQEGEEANLALSPEEEAVLAELSSPGDSSSLPVFLNGRAGSGKSTLLFYLFADYCDRKFDRGLRGSPLFLTYNERLVDTARASVKRLLQYHHRFLAQRGLRQDGATLPPIDEFFQPFQTLLLSMIPESERGRYQPQNHMSFHRFSELYLGAPLRRATEATTKGEHAHDELRKHALNPNRDVKWSPELCWYVLRTFVKGYLPESYMGPNDYNDVPRKERVVTDSTFIDIYETVWKGWYRSLTDTAGFWDDQDLVRHALESRAADFESDYTAIFCDEAQDFTRIELRLIMQLSSLTRFDLGESSPLNLPFAFAGDPFQTLNPTGFRWSACRAAFHDEVIDGVDPTRRYALDMRFKELLFNYRSTPPIVRLTNLVQLWRHVLFNHHDLDPQQWWGRGDFPEPEKFIIGRNLRDDDIELHVANTILLVPCEEGQENTYVRDDPELSRAFRDSPSDEPPKNVLSAVAAKGLEFKRVVLYKFGEKCPASVWATDSEAEEEALAAEYFFNKLYVAATRAREGLFVIDSNAGDERLWRQAERDGVERFLTKAVHAETWTDLVTDLVDGSNPGVMSEDDPAAIAAEFYEKGVSLSNAQHLRRAGRFYLSAGKIAEARNCDALAFRFEGDYARAGELFEALGMVPDAWRAYWDGLCWPALLSFYERTPVPASTAPSEYAMASFMAGFMMSRPDSRDALRDFAQQLTHWIVTVRGPLSPQWHAAVQQLRARAAQLSSDNEKGWNEEGWLMLAQVFEELEDRGHKGSLRSAATCYLRAGEPQDAVRCWERSGDTDQPAYSRTKADLTSFPEKLRWLAGLPPDGWERDDLIIGAWDEGKNLRVANQPLVVRVVAPILEKRGAAQAARHAQAEGRTQTPESDEAITRYREAFDLYVDGGATPDPSAALRCEAAARQLRRATGARGDSWSWIRSLVNRLIDHEMWSEVLAPELQQNLLPRSDSKHRAEKTKICAALVRGLAYTQETLFTATFPSQALLAALPEDRTRYDELARLLLDQPRRPLMAPQAPVDRERVNGVLQALRAEQWQHLLNFFEFGAAHEHAGSLVESLRFYESFFNAKSEIEREQARLRWIVTKARQIDLSQGARADRLRRELNGRIRGWSGDSPLG